jgi:hypothetical protein
MVPGGPEAGDRVNDGVQAGVDEDVDEDDVVTVNVEAALTSPADRTTTA